MAERDRLLAQTKAFVKEVAAAHPKSPREIVGDALKPGLQRSDAGPSPVRVQSDLEQTVVIAASDESFPAESVVAGQFVDRSRMDSERDISPPPRIIAGESDRRITSFSSAAKPATTPSDIILLIPRVATSERDDIAIRVSQFREHQRRLGRERELYSEQMRARIRSVIGNDGKTAET